ncbi:alpha,alpha-trehalose-phosphate synthase (UDP-forming) [Streptomyces xanthii]|uniref:Trehalose-6-phosphate synthase n=1 Tax=Streptomyces xanthii TaxID=2768069 RepID=A0A7H1B898_9ACTN|nr:trehalose-6-phosphate synthase [Streptomyces xanthii]QNS04953.1 trehalose-6-phosphate synthase [Streptomyces xanthii]
MASTPGAAEVLVASNRGPVSYAVGDDGTVTAKRGGGGLVSALSSVDDKLWVCAALGDGDREAVRRGITEPGVRMLDIDPEVHASAYNGIANSVLWFVHHMLYQTPLEPSFGPEFRRQWAAYEEYNRAFAQALADGAAPGATVVVQDYHLALVPGMLRALRPDLRIGHFSHTPWAPVDYFRMLPDDIAEQLLRGMLGADRLGFLTRRWADAFTECCARIVGGPGDTEIGVHGLGADAEFLRERAHREDVEERLAALREQVGAGRKVVVRVDRTELSKNIVRGLRAFELLLETRPEWRERVVHLAFAYPSRQDLEVYQEYTAEVSWVAASINSRFGTEDWTPVVLHVKDDFARSLAAYRLADVALVNPIRDGMNLVAKEVPIVSDGGGCVLVLSREAGAYEELGEDALGVNPYDLIGTAEALGAALDMPEKERVARGERLAAAGSSLPPAQWFLAQLKALHKP